MYMMMFHYASMRATTEKASSPAYLNLRWKPTWSPIVPDSSESSTCDSRQLSRALTEIESGF
eukprot:SAG11_NODE_170_length_13624_cov_40.078226_5_plen_62_part_00